MPQDQSFENDTAMEAADQSQMDTSQNDAQGQEHLKIFVRQLDPQTTEAEIKQYFSNYGEVVEVQISGQGGKPRGFGFITFSTVEAIDKIMETAPHTLKNKQIETQRIKPRPPIKQIFVKGLDATLTEKDLKEHFEKFGKIEAFVQPIDKFKNAAREFCFITFETEESAGEASKEATQSIKGKSFTVVKANVRRGSRRGLGRSFRGRGRGRGSYTPQSYSYRSASGYGSGTTTGYGSSSYSSYGNGYNSNYGSSYDGYGSYDNSSYAYDDSYGTWDSSSGYDYSQDSSYGKFKGGPTYRGTAPRGKFHPYARR